MEYSKIKADEEINRDIEEDKREQETKCSGKCDECLQADDCECCNPVEQKKQVINIEN